MSSSSQPPSHSISHTPSHSLSNPLLQETDFPPFATLQEKHILPAIDYILTAYDQEVERMTQQEGEASWENTVLPLESLDNQLECAFSLVSNGNDNSL